MIQIKIDLSSLKQEIDTIQDYFGNKVLNTFRRSIKNATFYLYQIWSDFISGAPTPEGDRFSSRTYRKALKKHVEGFTGTVEAEGIVPAIAETGIRSFDMKLGMLLGPNAKTSKQGYYYNVIPMKGMNRGSASFRVISSKNMQGWVHPGVKAKRIAYWAAMVAGPKVSQIILDALDEDLDRIRRA